MFMNRSRGPHKSGGRGSNDKTDPNSHTNETESFQSIFNNLSASGLINSRHKRNSGKANQFKCTMSEYVLKKTSELGQSVESDLVLRSQNMMFFESKIINKEQAVSLYFCCLDTKKAVTELPSTELAELFNRDFAPTPEDLLDKLSAVNQPTVFLIKLGKEIFGGYSHVGWGMDSEKTGSKKNFLFSLSKDCYIYPKINSRRQVYQFSDRTMLGWGATDLILTETVSFLFIFKNF